MPGINITALIQIILKLLLTGMAFLVLSIVCAALMILFSRILKVKRDREHVIYLTNRGNFISYFLLSVTSPENNLQFNLSLNGVPLVPVFIAPPAPVAAAQPAVEQPVVEQPRASQPQKPAPATSANSDQKKPAINTDGALKAGQAAAGKVGGMAAFLGTLGDLIPGSLGSSLRTRSAALRATQGNALSTMQAPVSAQHDLDSLKQQSGKLANVKPAAAGQMPAKPAVTSQAAQPAAQPPAQNMAANVSGPLQTTSGAPVTPPRPVAEKIAAPGEYVVQTQPLEPGDSYSLVLRIGPQKKRYPEGTFGYTLKSLQQPVENLTGEPVPVARQGVVNFPHVAAWRYWLVPALNILFFTMLLFASFYLFRIIWL